MFLKAFVSAVAFIAQLQLISTLPLTKMNFDALNYFNEDECNPNIKFVVFRTGSETPEQLALVPKIHPIAALYGSNKIEERELPTDSTYQSSSNQVLHSSWYKVQVTREVMDENPQVEYVLTFELSALPTDGSAAINFAALIDQNPNVSVFLKRAGSGFGMSMYKNNEETRKLVETMWEKRSEKSSVAASFAYYTFWNPSVLNKVKFL